jgi:hypothetical protein
MIGIAEAAFNYWFASSCVAIRSRGLRSSNDAFRAVGAI